MDPDSIHRKTRIVLKMTMRDQPRSLNRWPAIAFAKVPRKQFDPGVALDAGYKSNDTVVTERDSAGKATSSLSAPWLSLSAMRLMTGEGYSVLQLLIPLTPDLHPKPSKHILP